MAWPLINQSVAFDGRLYNALVEYDLSKQPDRGWGKRPMVQAGMYTLTIALSPRHLQAGM